MLSNTKGCIVGGAMKPITVPLGIWVTRNPYAAENLTLLRRWCLNLIKADKLKAKSSLKGRRKSAGWDNSYLLHLLGINLDA